MGGTGAHHEDLGAGRELTVDNAHIGDDTPIGVVDRVEDEGAGRDVGLTLRTGNHLDDPIEEFTDAVPGLGRDTQHVVGITPDDAGDLLGMLVGLGAGQVDLVEDRDDLQVGLESQVQVGQGLGLDTLGRVDEQDGTFAGLQGTRHLVGEVHVPGGVDHVEHVAGAVHLPRHAHRLGLDGDAAFPLDVHPVEILGAGITFGQYPRDLQHAIGQGRLAVVDVRNDAEVTDERLLGTARLRRGR